LDFSQDNDYKVFLSPSTGEVTKVTD
jgi:hypothetical protein